VLAARRPHALAEIAARCADRGAAAVPVPTDVTDPRAVGYLHGIRAALPLCGCSSGPAGRRTPAGSVRTSVEILDSGGPYGGHGNPRSAGETAYYSRPRPVARGSIRSVAQTALP
jgi:hypothetical protein